MEEAARVGGIDVKVYVKKGVVDFIYIANVLFNSYLRKRIIT
jgi:hypothetical protein